MRLNLGAGGHAVAGYAPVDLESEPSIDLGALPWPWPDASCDALLASHILEHFPREQGQRFLRECRRILQPGGVLRVAVPDMDRFIACHLSGDFSSLGGYVYIDLNYLLGAPPDADARAHWRHAYMYSTGSLAFALVAAGFTQIKQVAFDAALDNEQYQHISLYMEAA